MNSEDLISEDDPLIRDLNRERVLKWIDNIDFSILKVLPLPVMVQYRDRSGDTSHKSESPTFPCLCDIGEGDSSDV